MASPTKVTENRRKAKHKKMGHDRKVKNEKLGTTRSWQELFGETKEAGTAVK